MAERLLKLIDMAQTLLGWRAEDPGLFDARKSQLSKVLFAV